MFYKRGYVPKDVYRSWRASMDYYAGKERIARLEARTE